MSMCFWVCVQCARAYPISDEVMPPIHRPSPGALRPFFWKCTSERCVIAEPAIFVGLPKIMENGNPPNKSK